LLKNLWFTAPPNLSHLFVEFKQAMVCGGRR